MNWEDVLKAHQKFTKDPEYREYNAAYFEAVESMKKSRNDAILKFLKIWNPRVPCDANKLRKALKESDEYLKLLEGEKLRTIALEKSSVEVVKKIFAILTDTSDRQNITGASKIMHLLNRQLFPMWESKIREKYGCFSNAEGYINFMWRMQIEAKNLVEIYCRDHNCHENEAEEKIFEEYGETLPKLIDEYNFIITR